MTTEAEAVEAVRAFLRARNHWPWDEKSLTVRADAVEGRDVWVVSALEALPPGDEEWMRGNHEPVSHFVDVGTGEVLGYEVKRSRTILKHASP